MSIPESFSPYLDHIAIASDDLEHTVQFFETLGLRFFEEREVVEREQVRTAFASIDEKAHLEVLEPLSEGAGSIGAYLAKKGPGLHHLCFRVHDLKSLQERLTNQGVRFLYATPKEGAGGCLVNFMHPKSTGGILIELSEKASNKHVNKEETP